MQWCKNWNNMLLLFRRYSGIRLYT